MTEEKNPWSDWSGASQKRAFKRSNKKMSESFNKATEDFGTMGKTFRKLCRPGGRTTLGKLYVRKEGGGENE
jgi:hypothetical protein